MQDLEKAKINLKKALTVYNDEYDTYNISVTKKHLIDVQDKIESQKILDDIDTGPDQDKIL